MLMKTANAIRGLAKFASKSDDVWNSVNDADWKDSNELSNALLNVANGLFTEVELDTLASLAYKRMEVLGLSNEEEEEAQFLRLIVSKCQKLRES